MLRIENQPTETIRKSQSKTLIALVITCLLMSFQPSGLARVDDEGFAPAAAGAIDIGFGNGGKVATDFSGNLDVAYAIAVQPDGKILAAGETRTSDDFNTADFALARYNANGSLDSSFGSGGKVRTDFFGQYDGAFALAIQPDGKIISAGTTSVNAAPGFFFDFALVRYNADGTLDTSFGSGGKVTTNFFGFNDSLGDLALLPNGKIIAVGTAGTPGFRGELAIARYDANGSLDSTFGIGGKTTTAYVFKDEASTVAIQPDGRIVVAGGSFVADSTPVSEFFVGRYDANGTLDTSFGTGGKRIISVFGVGNEFVTGLAIQPDGHIVLSGRADRGSGSRQVVLLRLMPDGSTERSIVRNFIGSFDGAEGLAMQPDGKFLITGYSRVGPSSDALDMLVVRLNSDLTLDDHFGVGGVVTTDFAGFADAATAVAIQTDGRIVVAGSASSSSGFFSGDFGLARYETDADFSLAFDQATVEAERGTRVRVRANINRTGGLNNIVSVIPPDTSSLQIKISPPEPVLTSDPSVTFKLKIKAGAPTGPHSLVFYAKDDSGRVRFATLTLVIR